jgi:hypothetical protein
MSSINAVGSLCDVHSVIPASAARAGIQYTVSVLGVGEKRHPW